jgi:cysteinyl-tRNA synthetase
VEPVDAPIDWANPYAARFRDAMNDDFDTPIAFAVLHDLRGEVNRTRSRELAGLLKALGGTLGFLQSDPAAFQQGGVERSDDETTEIQALIDERNEAKRNKDYPRADLIRKKVEAKGIVLEDKPGGVTEWRKK